MFWFVKGPGVQAGYQEGVFLSWLAERKSSCTPREPNQHLHPLFCLNTDNIFLWQRKSLLSCQTNPLPLECSGSVHQFLCNVVSLFTDHMLWRVAGALLRRSSVDVERRRLSLGAVSTPHRASDACLDPHHAAILFRDSRGVSASSHYVRYRTVKMKWPRRYCRLAGDLSERWTFFFSSGALYIRLYSYILYLLHHGLYPLQYDLTPHSCGRSAEAKSPS